MDALERWRAMPVGRARRMTVLLALLLVALGAVGLHVGEATETAELGTIDARFRLRGSQQPDERLLMVAVDEVSLTGMDAVWPLPLERYTDALGRLASAGAATIVVDVTVASQTAADAEEQWAQAIELAGVPVVLASTQRTADGSPVVIGGDPALRAGAMAADARFDQDDDGTIRRFDAAVDGLPTIPAAAARAFAPSVDPGQLIGGEGATIDWAGPARTLETVSLASVLAGQVPDDLISGRLVVVGPSAPAVLDLHATPVAERMSGAEVHANAIATVLDGVPLRAPSVPAQTAIILLICLVPLVAVRLEETPTIVVVLAVLVAWLVIAQAAFATGAVLPVVAPLIGLVVGAFASLAIDYAFEAAARRQVREAFGRFVPDEVVRDLVDSGTVDGTDLLRARQWDVTVMFSDLRGFTTWADGREPSATIAMLNRYLGAMTDEIIDHRGVVISYMGDGIMAVFGAPAPYTEHPERALAAGLAMLEALEQLNDDLGLQGEGRFRMGVGLNAGPVVAGNLGTVRRLEYTMIGDTTNTASRVESLTKDADFDLLLTEAVRERMHQLPDDLIELAPVTLRGKSEPVGMYSVAKAGRRDAGRPTT